MAVFNTSQAPGNTGSVSITGASTFTVVNVDLTTANTEYSYTLPIDTKRFRIRLRDVATLKLYHTTGGTDYISIYAGECLEDDLLTTSATLYLQATRASQVAEIMIWT